MSARRWSIVALIVTQSLAWSILAGMLWFAVTDPYAMTTEGPAGLRGRIAIEASE